MDKVKLLVVVAAIVLGGVGWSATPAAHADVRDLGHFCITISRGFIPPLTERYGVLAYGPGLQYMVLTNATDQQHGSAVRIGDQIIITLSRAVLTADSAVVLNTIIQITLDVATLRGTFVEGLTSPPQDPHNRSLTGPASAIPCD